MYSFVLEWTPALTPGNFSPSLTVLIHFVITLIPVSSIKAKLVHQETIPFFALFLKLSS